MQGQRATLSLERFAVLGDLHVGRAGSLSFEGTVADIRSGIDALREAGAELVVLNGDVLDLERGALPLATNREWRHLRRLHAGLEQELQRPDVLVLAGNHDDALLSSGHAAAAVDIVGGNYRVRLEHGHRFDAPIKQWRRFATLATWASGRLVDSPLAGVYESMRRVEALLTGESRAFANPERLPDGLERRAMRWLLSTPTYDGLIIGHTHHAGFWTVGRSWLLNPGESRGPALAAVLVDLGAAQVQRLQVSSAGVESGAVVELPLSVRG